MANQTFSDILPDKRNQYARLKSKKAKSRFLTHLQEVYGFERKYLIKLLTGERTYHPHPGRGCTYGPEFARYALKLHEACKYLCAPYFRVRLPTLIKDWEAMKGAIPTDVKNQLLKASESTFARLFRKFPHEHTRQGNRKSGPNRLKDTVPACPGKRLEDGKPGVMQIDSVSHGGGEEEPHFWSLLMTDALTQWVEIAFIWCRGGDATTEGFQKMRERLPFDIRILHPDGGSEFINDKFLAVIHSAVPEISVFRSRPSRPNDNCRVEQKNRSILRFWMREDRLDNPKHKDKLNWLGERLALYYNLFVPCKKLIAKIPLEGKDVKYRYVYDEPKTPFERLKEADPENPKLARYSKLRNMINSVALKEMLEDAIAEVTGKRRGASSGGRGAACRPRPPELAPQSTPLPPEP